jgi:hypothetical protein
MLPFLNDRSSAPYGLNVYVWNKWAYFITPNLITSPCTILYNFVDGMPKMHHILTNVNLLSLFPEDAALRFIDIFVGSSA